MKCPEMTDKQLERLSRRIRNIDCQGNKKPIQPKDKRSKRQKRLAAKHNPPYKAYIVDNVTKIRTEVTKYLTS